MLDNRLVELSMAQQATNSQSLSRAVMPSGPDQSEETVFINPKIEDSSFSDDTLCSNTEEDSNQQQVMMERSVWNNLSVNVKVLQKAFMQK